MTSAVCASALVALASSGLGQAAPDQPISVVDRTCVVTVPVWAGLRVAYAQGQSGVRDQGDPSKWFALAHVGVSGLAGLQAGAPKVKSGAPQSTSSFGVARACRQTRARTPFAPAGLAGGRLGQLYESYKCVLPKRVRLRVRAVFREPVSLRVHGESLFTQAPVKAGYLAVQTEKGRPLVYGDVFESGRARLFLAANCSRA